VLFITRRFPPSIGGMQTLAAGVWRTLSAAAPASVLVAHGGSNRNLPLWLPRALARTARDVLAKRADLVLTGDAVMWAAAWPLLRLLRVPAATMVLGLDMTYDNPVYRAVVPRLLRRAETVVAISESTAAVARGLGVAPERIRVVRLGVDAPDVTPEQRAEARRRLADRLAVREDAILVLTLGRLVRRKGTEWFARDVLPRLPEQVQFVVAGEGREAEQMRRAVAELGLDSRVRLLGEVDDSERELLLRGADLFVQPNIAVPGDIEGFGLVTIEAAMRGLPVVAADLQGLAEAVVDGVTGTLLPPADEDAWTAHLATLTADRDALAAQGRTFQVAARERYSEQIMGDQLLAALGIADRPGGFA
jgi:phosphatidylinositol alpha-1,6-mannosyltransferase